MGLGLGHSVEIEHRLDPAQAALQPFGIGPVDPGEAIQRRLDMPRTRILRRGRRGFLLQACRREGRAFATRQWLHIANRFVPDRAIAPWPRCTTDCFHFPVA